MRINISTELDEIEKRVIEFRDNIFEQINDLFVADKTHKKILTWDAWQKYLRQK